MEGLINQAFVHIDSVGPHVLEGHYDLEGPEGELILKEIWDSTVQPGWQITMKMWPAEQIRRGPTAIRVPHGLSPEQAREWAAHHQRMRGRPVAPPGGPMGRPPGVPPVPPFGAFPGPHGPMPVGVTPVNVRPKKDRGKKKPQGGVSVLGAIFGAGATQKKKYEYLPYPPFVSY